MHAPRALVVRGGDPPESAWDSLLETDCELVTVDGVEGVDDWLNTAEFDCVVAIDRPREGDWLPLVRAVRSVDEEVPIVCYAEGTEPAAEAERLGARVVARDGDGADERFVDAVTAAIEAAGIRTDGAVVPKQEPVDVDEHAPSAEQIVRAIEEAPVGIVMTDPSLPDNPMVYVNEAFERLTGYDSSEVLGRNCRFLQGAETETDTVDRMRQGIDDEEPFDVELLNYRADGTSFWNRVTIAPIRDEEGDLEHFVGFQEDVTARKEAVERARQRAAELNEERQTLDRVLDRIDGLLNDITSELVNASDLPSLYRGVRERVVEASGYRGAWVAKTDRTGGETVAEITAGEAPAAVGTEIPLDGGDGPVARAYRTNRVVIADEGPIDVPAIAPAEVGAEGIAVVPLTYRRTTYGFLGVYLDPLGTADHRETKVLEALGRMIGAGINAVRTRQALRTDTVLELGFVVEERTLPMVRLAEALGAPVRYGRSEVDDDGGRRLHVVVESSTVDAEAISDLPSVRDVIAVVERNDESIVSVETGELPVIEELSANGLTVHRLRATPDGTAEIEVTTAPDTDVRTVLGLLEDLCETVEFVSQHERENHGHDPGEFVASVREKLTDRQHAALETAYLGGYFEWPRHADGDELAASMGISRQTFHQHLRAAEAKLLSAFFE